MFILPLMVILLGVEFYLVFERTTNSYEKGLREGYTMLVVTKEPMTLSDLKALSPHISSSEPIEREEIVHKVLKGVTKSSTEGLLHALPYFYNVGLDAYLKVSVLEEIKQGLESSPQVKRVETFGSSYADSYRLFSFIKLVLKLFIGFMSVVSLFLIIKQMEIWKYLHKQRMQIMEVFGAPLMLRSGVLFKVAIFDAIIATMITSLIFFFIKYKWAAQSGIEIMVQKQEALFRMSDIGLLLGVALSIVILAVYIVVFSSKGVQE
jgi:cell division transport system permease protein